MSKKWGSESENFLQELKAKQEMRDQQKNLLQKIEKTHEAAGTQRAELQKQLNDVKSNMRIMGDARNIVGGGSTSSSQPAKRHNGLLNASQLLSAVGKPGGKDNLFNNLCNAVAAVLRRSPGQKCMLSLVASQVQTEWSALQNAHVISKKTKMKEVLMERRHLFEVLNDGKGGQPTVRLVCDPENPGANTFAVGVKVVSSVMMPQATSIHVESPLSNTLVATPKKAAEPVNGTLRPDQIAAIEGHLRKVGGSERVSQIGTMFGIKKIKLTAHFNLVNHLGETWVKLSQDKMRSLSQGKCYQAPSETENVTERVENYLAKLTPERAVVCQAMIFCLDASQHAAPIARRLITALEEPSLTSQMLTARLFLVNDVLWNSNSTVQGASRFRTIFTELLPDAFDRMRRVWLEAQVSARGIRRVESAARKVLEAWREWSVFTPLFTQGLEVLFFSRGNQHSLEGESAKADVQALNDKIVQWCAGVDEGRLIFAARIRGLTGSGHTVETCRERLCQYLRYYHHLGRDDNELWAEGIPALKEIKSLDEPKGEEDTNSIDGELLSEGEEDLISNSSDHVKKQKGRMLGESFSAFAKRQRIS
eukprot:gnl/MRDRNA2_/MRDRNA2_76484_c0_seq1.p1 gnl/MRDRNA2_/MRDRNA2_76484_c0~~gnl/MRDRNA2_/MRDRNA2_76484_c0_seq1.p1  ORF type:complete len:592 (+),score=108.81 gnl/MRDRNA2_/MRDRNA2_76484_c0_seq1:88-1863(+)